MSRCQGSGGLQPFTASLLFLTQNFCRRKEFRGKLAIAITANFTNKRTTAEAIVDEISGVAFVYKQDFFNNLYDEFGIALENIVYYKDDTHYFVMTTKKHSLLDRKVLKKDMADPIALLSPKNVSKDALYEYIRDACDYCTDYQLPHLEFALNHHGEPDVALFDFTSMFASNAACHIMEKDGKQLMCGLVGDGLLEPFWPTGTGIARGFLGAFDTVWAIKIIIVIIIIIIIIIIGVGDETVCRWRHERHGDHGRT